MARKPQQGRSKATVEAIIEAGFVCVARYGIAGTTTRHIAEVAGISVGSLYEYFENKERVYDAMTRRLVGEVTELIERQTPEFVRLDIHGAIVTLVSAFGELLGRNDDRYLKVTQQAVQSGRTDRIEPVRKALMELVMKYLMNHPEYLGVRDIPTMSYIFVVGGIHAVMHHLSSPTPEVSFEQLTEGLAKMVSYYVQGELQVAGRAQV